MESPSILKEHPVYNEKVTHQEVHRYESRMFHRGNQFFGD